MGRRVASYGKVRLAILRSARPLWSAGERNSARSRGENLIKEDRRWDFKIYCAQKEVSRRRSERKFLWHRTRNCPPRKFSDIAARKPGTGWHRILRGRKTQQELGMGNANLGIRSFQFPSGSRRFVNVDGPILKTNNELEGNGSELCPLEKMQLGTRNGQLGYCNSELPIVNYERLYEKRLIETNRRLRLGRSELEIPRSTLAVPSS